MSKEQYGRQSRARLAAWIAAFVFLSAAFAFTVWYLGTERVAVHRAIAHMNEGDWGELFRSTIADEPRLMQCDAASFSALMDDVLGDERLTFRLQAKYTSSGARPVSTYVVDVFDSSGKRLRKTLSLYVAKQDGRYRVSVADLPFQLALLAAQDPALGMVRLAEAMEEHRVVALLNPHDMIMTSPGRLRDAATVPTAELNPAQAWTRAGGF